ncbi:hypothetical protein S40285_09844 [Stachybotrys chlorohalonatus IBT 40285]|uniref:Uncharacterized protein n=1 Tax=Stachybotrys chlorohalonatus (strain IBT 40285) TaxID=1283841 RepID=A0A084QNG7_STAC4|nr:hypothetical protein S40285_09844 [Stachybotrys chlorohalonata IBT 40285]
MASSGLESSHLASLLELTFTRIWLGIWAPGRSQDVIGKSALKISKTFCRIFDAATFTSSYIPSWKHAAVDKGPAVDTLAGYGSCHASSESSFLVIGSAERQPKLKAYPEDCFF